MADEDAALKSALNRHVGDDLERVRGGIGAFVDVEVELPALAVGEVEQNFEALAQARDRVSHRAKDSGSMGVEHRLDTGHVSRVQRELDAEKRRRLHFDPVAPALARFGENRPANARLRADTIDVGAKGGRPICVS